MTKDDLLIEQKAPEEPELPSDVPKEQLKKANVPNFIERNRILAAQKAMKT